MKKGNSKSRRKDLPKVHIPSASELRRRHREFLKDLKRHEYLAVISADCSRTSLPLSDSYIKRIAGRIKRGVQKSPSRACLLVLRVPEGFTAHEGTSKRIEVAVSPKALGHEIRTFRGASRTIEQVFYAAR